MILIFKRACAAAQSRYTNDIPKLNMEILHPGQGCRTLLVPQTVSSKRLDEIDWLQCSDIMPEGQAIC